jgi:hypothetical protein
LEVPVGLEAIILSAIGIWVAMMFFAISLCRAAKRSDDAMDTALAQGAPVGYSAQNRDSLPAELPLRTLELDQAATLLGVSPEMLLAWEARYGFPTASPADPCYSESEVLALRESLSHAVSIAAAVDRARRRTRRRWTSTGGLVRDHRGSGLAS